MVENVTQIKNGIKINIGISVRILKNIICAKKVISEILLRVAVKMANI